MSDRSMPSARLLALLPDGKKRHFPIWLERQRRPANEEIIGNAVYDSPKTRGAKAVARA
jgi:hypothetical protein